MTEEIADAGLKMLEGIRDALRPTENIVEKQERERLKELERMGILIDICENLGFLSWDILNEEQKKKAYFGKFNTNYYTVKYFKFEDQNIYYAGFKRVGTKKENENFQNEYVINCTSGRPTKKFKDSKLIGVKLRERLFKAFN